MGTANFFWIFISLSLFLQVPVGIVIISLGVTVQRLSQSAFIETLNNREKQLAYIVDEVVSNYHESIAQQKELLDALREYQSSLPNSQELPENPSTTD